MREKRAVPKARLLYFLDFFSKNETATKESKSTLTERPYSVGDIPVSCLKRCENRCTVSNPNMMKFEKYCVHPREVSHRLFEYNTKSDLA